MLSPLKLLGPPKPRQRAIGTMHSNAAASSKRAISTFFSKVGSKLVVASVIAQGVGAIRAKNAEFQFVVVEHRIPSLAISVQIAHFFSLPVLAADLTPRFGPCSPEIALFRSAFLVTRRPYHGRTKFRYGRTTREAAARIISIGRMPHRIGRALGTGGIMRWARFEREGQASYGMVEGSGIQAGRGLAVRVAGSRVARRCRCRR